MTAQRQPNVALLLATYNGSSYVETQIRSLADNKTHFTLHWLDDHSTDDTQEVVRATAQHAHIELREWHQAQRQNLPGSFFRLLESVDADIYLFCDQDDIWQPRKIDATVANLLSDSESPVLCFSDGLLFDNDRPQTYCRESEVGPHAAIPEALRESRMFMPACASGHTQGFTRPLRELFLRHHTIARTYAFMHDWWMYNIAVAAGTARLLKDVPTTLYRQHQDGFCKSHLGRPEGTRITRAFRRIQLNRRIVSRHAQGFVLASQTLPPSSTLERVVEIAQLVATLDRRQSPRELVRLKRRDIIPSWQHLMWFAAASLLSSAALPALTHGSDS